MNKENYPTSNLHPNQPSPSRTLHSQLSLKNFKGVLTLKKEKSNPNLLPAPRLSTERTYSDHPDVEKIKLKGLVMPGRMSYVPASSLESTLLIYTTY